MTDHDPLDPRDELASAHLDGETSPDEAALVAGDADLAERVRAFADVRDAVAAADAPADPERREQAIAAALGAADGGSVVSLAEAARRRSRRRTQLLGVAAAAVLAVAVGLPLALRHHGSGHPITTAAKATGPAAPTTTIEAPALPFSAAAGGSTGGAAPTEGRADASPVVLDLGRYPDQDGLEVAVRDQLDVHAAPLPAASAADATSAQTCAARTPSDRTVLLVGVASVDGQRVVVVVTQDRSVVRQLATVTPAPDCTAISDEPL